ncbi:uncharacterized protein LOC111796914 [Cucurbita pepo subsp. pepo]|uniref:uncharacterized protein LOC111796914 n=1 Tax=Cucurbita pepo subsp. pepo TaxID=3664 RepID=UPI000C9DA0D0|nr:uncharacterized protein LOC111796914 [Cucurbita pepo subsp. pepo]
MSKNFKMILVCSAITSTSKCNKVLSTSPSVKVHTQKKLMNTVGLADSNPIRTPMEARLQLRKAGTTTIVDSTNYRSIVGSLCYLVNTRPDLAYFVGYVSKFIEAPRKEYLVAVKRILRYVAGTRGLGVRYYAGR